jgi:hypothetical protein
MLSRNDALQLMMPLADALQFSLFLCKQDAKRIDQGGAYTITEYFIKGHGDFGIPVGPREIGFKCKVIASGIDGKAKTAYVIVSVAGDLWILVCYDGTMKELNFSMIDASHVPNRSLPAVYSGKTMKALYDLLLPYLVGMWMREERNEQWSRLDEVADVGESTVALPETEDRPAHIGGTG